LFKADKNTHVMNSVVSKFSMLLGNPRTAFSQYNELYYLAEELFIICKLFTENWCHLSKCCCFI